MNRRGASTMQTVALALGLLMLDAALLSAADTGGPRVWCHLCPWFLPNNLSHNRYDFPLGMDMETWPGMAHRQEPQAQRDRICEVHLAQEAGIDAFAIDLLIRDRPERCIPAFNSYLAAAETVTRETGRPFRVTPCLDGVWTKTPEALADLVSGMLAGCAHRAAWPRHDGRWVVWTYGGTQWPAAKWRETIDLLSARGTKILVILDANALYARVVAAVPAGDTARDPWAGLPVDELDVYAGLPVALYPFRTDFDRSKERRCLAYLDARHPASFAARLSVGTVWPGYWSSVSGWHVDAQATGRIRDSFEAASACDWINITTWNDYVETTHFQPSLAFGSGRLDLLRALLSRRPGNGAAWSPVPRIYLWQPADLQCGDPLKAEVLALLPAGTADTELCLTPCDAGGQPVCAPQRASISGEGVRTVAYDFATDNVRAGSCVHFRLETMRSRERKTTTFAPIPVWPAGYHPDRTRRGVMAESGHASTAGPGLAIERADGAPVAIRVTWPEAVSSTGARLFVRRGSRLLRIVREPQRETRVDLGVADRAGPAPWERYSALPPRRRWGFFDAIAVLPDGRLLNTEPLWLAPDAAGIDMRCAGFWPLDAPDGTRCEDLSLHGHHAILHGNPKPVTPGHVGAGCLALDGIDDYISVPGGRFPSEAFTVQLWVRPEAAAKGRTPRNRMCLYADINGGIVLSIGPSGRLSLQRAGARARRVVTAGRTLPPGVWTHVAAVYDGRTLRIYQAGSDVGSTPCTGSRRSNVTAIGCNPFGDGSAFYRGQLDAIRVDARAWHASELAAAVASPGE